VADTGIASASLQERLRELEDRVELGDLVQRYNLAMDDQDWDVLLELFSSDCTLGPRVGRDEVVGLLREIREGHGRTRHLAHGQVLTFTGPDTCEGVVPASSELDMEGTSYRVANRYLDTYVREGGAWRIQRRRTLFHYVLPLAELHHSYISDEPVRWPGRPPARGHL
jgi:hypothetical protein